MTERGPNDPPANGLAHPPKLLLDVRENQTFRGFHVMAAAYLLSPELAACEVSYLSSDNVEERAAVDAFCFDTGIVMVPWEARETAIIGQFDLYAAILECDVPDKNSHAAHQCSRQTLLGLCFPCKHPERATTFADGNDTTAFASLIKQMLAIH